MFRKLKSFLFENKTAKQTVAKNTLWLSISNFGGRALKAVIIIYAARVLGTAGYGVFSYAVTLAGFFTFFVDPGVNSILVRDGSRANTEDRRELFSSSFILKLAFIAIGVVFVLSVAPFFSTLPGAKTLLPLVALIVVFDSLRDFFSSFFRAEEKMQWDAFTYILENLGIAVFGFLFLRIASTPLWFSRAYVAGTAFGALIAVWLIRRSLRALVSHVSFARMRAVLAAAWPFAVTSALGILLTNTDILIISWMRTAADVGIYAAAIRIVQVLYIVPGIIQLSTLPVFSRFAKKDDEKFRNAFERTSGLIFLVSIPLSLGGAILGAPIMKLVFGTPYAAGGLAFSILMLGLSFDFASIIFANAIFSYDRQKSLIAASVIGGAANVVFDLLFIPHWGIAGSAVATLCAQILTNSYLWYAANKLNRVHVLRGIKKITIAGISMAAVTALLFAAHVNVLLNIAVSGAFYFSILFLLKEPLFAEMKKVFAAVEPS